MLGRLEQARRLHHEIAVHQDCIEKDILEPKRRVCILRHLLIISKLLYIV